MELEPVEDQAVRQQLEDAQYVLVYNNLIFSGGYKKIYARMADYWLGQLCNNHLVLLAVCVVQLAFVI